jgi:hypothetical protein
MAEKLFEGYLCINWKTGKMVAKKRKPHKEGPFEVLIHLKIKAVIPDKQDMVAEGSFIVPQTKVEEMVIHSI